jgi:hypothetical protein
MKAIASTVFLMFAITATITHIWTVVIAFTVGGFLAGIVSLFLPFLSELFWMFSMFGENNAYAVIALAHLVLAIPISIFTSQ